MTSKNNPSVKIVKGIVNKTKSGFRKVLRNESTIAISNALVKFVTSIPGKSHPVKKTAKPEIRSFNNI